MCQQGLKGDTPRLKLNFRDGNINVQYEKYTYYVEFEGTYCGKMFSEVEGSRRNHLRERAKGI